MDEQTRTTLQRLLEWHDRATDEADDCGYLNGDSHKYEGNGWDDIAAIVADARSALTSA